MEQVNRKTLQQMIEQQVGKWELAPKPGPDQERPEFEPVITVSRLPGCNAGEIVQKTAEKLGFDVFNGKLVEMVAQDANLSQSIAETLDEKQISAVEEWVKGLIVNRYFSPDNFFFRLSKIIGAIGRHGHAIIVGRGASMMLPPHDCLRVLLVAPLEVRIDNVVRKFNVPREDARRRIINRESDRRAYVRRYFNADMTDPLLYDIVLNTEGVGMDASSEIMVSAWKAKQALRKVKH